METTIEMTGSEAMNEPANEQLHSPESHLEQAVAPGDTIEAQGCGCGGNKGATPKQPSFNDPSYVYAIGNIRAIFPRLDIEKEFYAAVKRDNYSGLTDQQLIYETIRKPENEYLARAMTYVFSIENIDTFIIQQTSDAVLKQLIEAINPKNGEDCDVLIGQLGGIASPDIANGLQLPIAGPVRIYSFEVDDFVSAMPKTAEMSDESIRELFRRIQQLADNSGVSNEHRALNYLATQYPELYSLTADMFNSGNSLKRVYIRPSRLAGSRSIIQVVFVFIDRRSGVEQQYSVRVDTQGMFPHLVSALQPYYDR